MESIRSFFNKLLISTILSYLILYTTNIDVIHFFLIIFLMWVWLLWNYDMKKT
ncbi:hypothetical protein SAMN02194393_05180 [Maledivibacter halophilus]|uniref:Uncharacterized protein n=1 Tax=Maledivibacter halophilus TaxID=36842 RepID=A0A1T5MRG9_9FIRM|nr:hypothetical protein SAMN02194393_05180 [Maledivibacter halophilus]